MEQWKFDNIGTKNVFAQDENTIINKKFTTKSNSPDETDDDDFRRAGIIHKVVRAKVRQLLQPNTKITDIVTTAEQLSLAMTKQNQTTYYINGGPSGIAFPVGININNVIAHDTKRYGGDDRILHLGDIVKIDMGIHINGNIVDSAFTEIIGDTKNNSPYVALLDAAKDAMFSAIALSGPDQLLMELSETIAEIIESYEIDTGKIPLPVCPVKNIGGHDIKLYKVHGDKIIYSAPNELQRGQRMLENEIYAIETYATTGSGNMTQNDTLEQITHFKYNPDAVVKKRDQDELYTWMQTRTGLPFSIEWAKHIPKLNKHIKKGIENKTIVAYPPLYDMHNSCVAQFEHTIRIKDGGVEIFSLGNDY